MPAPGFGRLFSFTLHTHPVDHVEQQQGNQCEKQDEQERVEIPEIRHDYIANFGKRLNGRENILISETVNNCANKKTKETRDDIVELAFAATGSASAWSVTCERHTYTKYQSTNDVPDNISGGHRWENDQSQAAQTIQADHRNHESGQHEFQHCQVGETKDADNLVIFCQSCLV